MKTGHIPKISHFEPCYPCFFYIFRLFFEAFYIETSATKRGVHGQSCSAMKGVHARIARLLSLVKYHCLLYKLSDNLSQGFLRQISAIWVWTLFRAKFVARNFSLDICPPKYVKISTLWRRYCEYRWGEIYLIWVANI